MAKKPVSWKNLFSVIALIMLFVFCTGTIYGAGDDKSAADGTASQSVNETVEGSESSGDPDAQTIVLQDIGTALEAGQTAQIQITSQPDWFAADCVYAWTSSDETVATVDSTGTVTAVGTGTAVITAECSGVSAQTEVAVSEPAAATNDEMVTEDATEEAVSALTATARATAASDTVTVTLPDGRVIKAYHDDTYYLFLPKDVDRTSMTIAFNSTIGSTTASGVTVSDDKLELSGDFSNITNFTVTTDSGKEIKVTIKQSDLPSMYITLNGTDLSTINGGSKDTKYPGNSVMLTGSDSDLSATGVEIKGRGNATWKYSKRPYQIKFDSKTEVLGMDKAKKWVLLANYTDASLLRNKISYGLAESLGMEGTPACRSIDLWIDGEFLGSYLICEKIDIASGSVDLNNDNAALVELDNSHYQDEEDQSIVFSSSKSGAHFVLKENKGDAQTSISIVKDQIDDFETALYSNYKDWNKIKTYIDPEEFAKYFIVEEYTKNTDAMCSSAYMYMDGSADILHIGPVWDNDNSLGNMNYPDASSVWLVDNTQRGPHMVTWYSELMKIPEFKAIVSKIYDEQAKSVITAAVNSVKADGEALSNSADMNFIRWKQLGKASPAWGSSITFSSTYSGNVNTLSDWMKTRLNYMNSKYSGYSAPIKDGKTYTLASQLNTSKLVEVDGGKTANGANIHLWAKKTSAKEQQFKAKQNSDGSWTFTNVKTGKVLDVAGNGSANGTNVNQYSSNGTSAQKWCVIDFGSDVISLINKNGKAMDVAGSTASNGSNIQIYSTNRSNAQKFKAVSTSSSSSSGSGSSSSGSSSSGSSSSLPSQSNSYPYTYTISSKLNSNKVIDIAGGSTSSGANVQLYSSNGSTAQQFKVLSAGDSKYYIQNVKSGKVLDVSGAGTANGTNVDQYTYNGSKAQQWTFQKNSDGSYSFISACNGLALDISGASTSNGTNIQCYKYNGSNAQKWTLNKK